MSVAMCIETAGPMPTSVILAVLEALVQHNVSLYARGFVKRAPWSYIWVPDPVVVCDGGSCRLADVSKQQDVMLLERNGQGSCGPLGCAYAAWLRFDEKAPAVVELATVGTNKYHVTARVRDAVYDPQVIGRRAGYTTSDVQQGGAQWP